MLCGGGKDGGRSNRLNPGHVESRQPRGWASKRSALTLSAVASIALPGEPWAPDLLAQGPRQWGTRQSESISLGGGRLGKGERKPRRKRRGMRSEDVRKSPGAGEGGAAGGGQRER